MNYNTKLFKKPAPKELRGTLERAKLRDEWEKLTDTQRENWGFDFARFVIARSQ